MAEKTAVNGSRYFSPPARRMALLAGAGLLALYLGFVRFSPAECAELVRATGYWWMLAVFTGILASLAWCGHKSGWRKTWHRIWPGRNQALFLALAAVWLLAMDRPGYKIYFDEPLLASTAFTLHTERELSATMRAYPLPAVYTILRTNLDKRSPFYPFLVAMLHDLSGWRPANGILVNAGGTVLLLWLVWLLGRRYGGGPLGGSLAVALLCTLPELGVCATGAGMDLVNLLLLAALWLAALLYLDEPDTPRLALLLALTLALAYSRYESVLYVAAAGAIWLVSAHQRRAWVPELIWAVLPLGLLLYAWHNAAIAHAPEQWEVRPDQAGRFGLAYVTPNLVHAARFLLTPGWHQPNSILIALAGLAGGAWLAIGKFFPHRTAMEAGPRTTLLAFGAAIAANFAVLMSYFWGALDDPAVTRLSLPLYLGLTLLAVAGWREVMAWRPHWGGWRAPGYAVGAGLLVLTVPAVAVGRLTESNVLRQSLEWEQRVVAAQWPAPGLIISNRSPLVWLAGNRPAISLDRARRRGAELRWHLQHHSFSSVLVVQRALTLGAGGGWAVDELDQLPADWQLEEVAVRRIGLTLTRISRLVEVPAPAGAR